MVLVDVAPADSHSAHAQEDLPVPGLRPRHLAHLDRAILELVLHHREHPGHAQLSFTRFTKSRMISKRRPASAPGLSSWSATASGAPMTTRSAPSPGHRAA